MKTEPRLQPRLNIASPPQTDGAACLPLLNRQQQQLVLGTLLGDASLNFQAASPVYAANHSLKQAAYCLEKHQILSAFVRTPPAVTKNGGFGKWLMRFATTSQPAFTPLVALMYRPAKGVYSTGKQKLKKIITPQLLAAIDQAGFWETLAWWIGDDGHLTKKHRMQMNTQGFTKADIQRLVGWLRRHGLVCTSELRKPSKTSKRKRPYWIIIFSRESTETIVEQVRPHMPSSMAYKVAPPRTTKEHRCTFCGKAITMQRYFAPEVTARMWIACDNKACQQWESHLRYRKRFEAGWRPKKPTPEQRQALNAYLRDWKRKNRDKVSAYARKAYPRRREAINAYRRERRAKMKAEAGTPTAVCERCQGQFVRTNKSGKVQYCSTCKPIIVTENKRRHYLARKQSASSASASPAIALSAT